MNALRTCEQAALAEGREWTRRRLETLLQAESDALPASCPQSGQPLSNTRWRALHLLTVAGEVRRRVRHGYSAAGHRWVGSAREAWGLAPYQRLSPEFEARLSYTATETGSYERAARMATTWGSPASDGCIHNHLQRLGARAADLELPTPVPPPHEAEFSPVLMLDGWLARGRGPDWGASPRKPHPQRIAWHEIKSAVIYRLEQRAQNASGRGLLVEKSIVATPPETSPVDFGAAVQAEARRRGLGRAHTVYGVMDGAVWLWDLVEDRLATALKTVDFHHARDDLWAIAHLLHGQDSPEARAWVEPLVRSLRTGGQARVVRTLEQLLEPPVSRPAAVQKQLDREVRYFQNHRDHLHYQTMEKAGAPRGSGAVESLGKQLQRRLRGCGQSWSQPGLTHLLRVCVLVKNRDAPLLWN